MSSTDQINHAYGFGPHRCRRGHSFKIKFSHNKSGVVDGYTKVCQRCDAVEVRELGRGGSRVVHIEKSKLGKVDDPG